MLSDPVPFVFFILMFLFFFFFFKSRLIARFLRSATQLAPVWSVFLCKNSGSDGIWIWFLDLQTYFFSNSGEGGILNLAVRKE